MGTNNMKFPLSKRKDFLNHEFKSLRLPRETVGSTSVDIFRPQLGMVPVSLLEGILLQMEA